MYTKDNNNGILFFIYFVLKKAFDRLEWDFLNGYLRLFNFRAEFIIWVENVQSCVKNNGSVLRLL